MKQLNLGLSVLIPESYIPNLNTRLYFYRKLAYLQSVEDLKLAKLEMFERFGELPKEVSHLIEITELRVLCKLLSIEKFDLGNRGLIIKFRDTLGCQFYHGDLKELKMFLIKESKI